MPETVFYNGRALQACPDWSYHCISVNAASVKDCYSGQANILGHQFEEDKNHEEQFECRMGHVAQATGHCPGSAAAGSRRSAPVVLREATEKAWLDPVALRSRPLTICARQQTYIEEVEMLECFTYTLMMYGVVMAAAWICALVAPW